MNGPRRVDIAIACTGIDSDGNEISGTLTARVDLSQAPWPEQLWEGCEEGMNPLRNDGGGAPISIKRIIGARILQDLDLV